MSKYTTFIAAFIALFILHACSDGGGVDSGKMKPELFTEKFNKAELMGKTKKEVIAKLGAPDKVDGDKLLYYNSIDAENSISNLRAMISVDDNKKVIDVVILSPLQK